MKRHLPLLLLALSVALVGGNCNNKPVSVTITSPTHGSFTTQTSLAVSGQVGNARGNTVLTVNGVVVPIVSGAWSTTLAVDTNELYQPILAEVTTGQVVRRARSVVVYGEFRADGAYSEQSVALRLNDSGLDTIEPTVSSFVNLDLATLLPPGTEVLPSQCVIDGGFLGCLGSASVSIRNPPPSTGGFSLDVDSMTNFAAGDVIVNNVQVFTRVNGTGLAPSCDLDLSAAATTITGDYGLQPDSVDPTTIDVNLIGSPGIFFQGFSSEFTSGICDFPLIGDIVQAVIGDIEPLVTGGLVGFLSDPDGGGPADAPIAEGIETALADISISGPIGAALAVNLDTPLFDVIEDTAGITLGSDSSFVASVGTGAGQCDAPPEAPDLPGSLHVSVPFPTFSGTTPVGGLPYGLGLCVSSSAFNQLLKAQVECGLLVTSITELSIPPLIPNPIPITSDLLAFFVPQLAALPPGTPMRIDIKPTIGPAVTGNMGPAGELAELDVGALDVQVIVVSDSSVALSGQVDVKLGLDLSFDDVLGELVFTLGTPAPAEITVAIIENPYFADALNLETQVLPSVISLLLPDLASDLAAFPIPDFLGLGLQGVEVGRQGEFMSLFADLVAP